jgi:hypothetical protein
VAVSADDLALCDLVQNALPPAIVYRGSDRESLVADVVELEDDRVCFAAVDARVRFEVLDEIHGPIAKHLSLQLRRLIDVALAVGLVVLSAVGRAAWPAEIVALALPLPTPCKL